MSVRVSPLRSLWQVTYKGKVSPFQRKKMRFLKFTNTPGDIATDKGSVGKRSVQIPFETKFPILHNILTQSLTRCLPFNNFSNSIYSVPMLLLFRLFYQATTFPTATTLPPQKLAATKTSTDGDNTTELSQVTQISASSTLLNTFARIDVSDFLSSVESDTGLGNVFEVRTLTWTKALASPLSHEFLQVIIQHVETCERFRIIVERAEWGDTVTVGWDWSSGGYASPHHTLPLPLLTASYNRGSGPSLNQFANILLQSSKTRRYNLLREMCWWYAEKVFVHTTETFPGGIIKEWPHANLRYSFVVKTDWIERSLLVRAAEEFRDATRNGMSY